jgi:predicted HTH domain antitoxin
VPLEIPESAMRAIGNDAEAKVRLWAAVKGYELHELSTGAAAELAGLSTAEFLEALGQFGISVLSELTPEELARDADVARRARGR